LLLLLLSFCTLVDLTVPISTTLSLPALKPAFGVMGQLLDTFQLMDMLPQFQLTFKFDQLLLIKE
jgi:hypothetical protein